MKKDKVIFLVRNIENEEPTNTGELTYNKERRKILAGSSSIKQSEFYQANANGFKPVITFVVSPWEYKGEDELEYNSAKYRIIRTYEKNSTDLELVCEGNVNGNT